MRILEAVDTILGIVANAIATIILKIGVGL